MNEIEQAARHWEALADSAEEMAAWERDIGIDMSPPGHSVGDNQARLYRQTAEAIRITARTGVHHCACHLIPVSDCAMRTNIQGPRGGFA